MNIIEAIEAVKSAQQKVYHPKYTLDGDIVIFSSVNEKGVLSGKSLTLEHITPELLDGWCIYNVIERIVSYGREEQSKEQLEHLDWCLDKMAKALDGKGVNYFFSKSYIHYNSPVRGFRRLLDDTKYGFKAIVLLWEALMQEVARNHISYLEAVSTLYRVFPWQEEASLNDMCVDSILTIEDWLIENCREEMMVNFLNKEVGNE